MSNLSNLLSNYQLGDLTLQNRLIMAPMTRGRAGVNRVPNSLMAEYYAQRASAGLIITEATQISLQGIGWTNTPGIHTQEQVKGWQLVTEAVHAKGGLIFLQLWHTGRASHPDFQVNGALPVSASAIKPQGDIHVPSGKKPFVTPRALEIEEIAQIVQDYANATKLAKEAGFDGVEIHGANGYLIDQFLRDGSNHRTDIYGGSIENRARFLLEVTEAVVNVWSPNRVGVRFSPVGTYNDMGDSDPVATFSYATNALNQLKLAYLHILEALPGHIFAVEGEPVWPTLRKIFQGTFMINGGYDAVLGEEVIATGQADLVAYGTTFLANPDLVERFRIGATLNQPDVKTFYSDGSEGYIDYPTLV